MNKILFVHFLSFLPSFHQQRPFIPSCTLESRRVVKTCVCYIKALSLRPSSLYCSSSFSFHSCLPRSIRVIKMCVYNNNVYSTRRRGGVCTRTRRKRANNLALIQRNNNAILSRPGSSNSKRMSFFSLFCSEGLRFFASFFTLVAPPSFFYLLCLCVVSSKAN